MKTGTKKAWKITAFVLLGLIAAVILAAAAYVLYVVIEYDRIEDNLVLSVENPIDGKYLEIGESYTAVTYNIGFGAYSPDFSFFMDSGEMLDGTVVTGKYGKAIDKEHVLKDITGSVNVLKESKADFILVQEADTDADRSYHVDQYAALKEALSGYSSTFAVNFHSAYLMYPLNDHHGKSTAGIATFSAYGITESVRRSYPVDDGFAKFFDLDRCFSVNRIAVEGGKELVLIPYVGLRRGRTYQRTAACSVEAVHRSGIRRRQLRHSGRRLQSRTCRQFGNFPHSAEDSDLGVSFDYRNAGR